jgi:cell division protein FtsB
MRWYRFRRYDLLVTLGCLVMLSSFAWYALKGPRGYAYGDELDAAIAELDAENLKLATEREGLEKRVRLMRPEHVDRDMLEQLARSELEMAYPNELVVKTQN